MKSPKAPKPTAQQIAVERRQAAALDEEIREQEERFAAMARGKLGTKSLLGGVPRSRAEAAGTGVVRLVALVLCLVWAEWAALLPVVLVALHALAPTMALCLNFDRYSL